MKVWEETYRGWKRKPKGSGALSAEQFRAKEIHATLSKLQEQWRDVLENPYLQRAMSNSSEVSNNQAFEFYAGIMKWRNVLMRCVNIENMKCDTEEQDAMQSGRKEL